MEWCLDRVIANDLELDDVIWTDECSVSHIGRQRITSRDQSILENFNSKCIHADVTSDI